MRHRDWRATLSQLVIAILVFRTVFPDLSVHRTLWTFENVQVGPRLAQFSLNSPWHLYFVNSSNNSNLQTSLGDFILGSIWAAMDESQGLCCLIRMLCSLRCTWAEYACALGLLRMERVWSCPKEVSWELSGSPRNMSWIGKSRKAFVVKKVEGRLSGNHASSITG